jgi:hypothetical protein
MYRWILALCFLLTVVGTGLPSVPRPRSPVVVRDTEPDPRKARPLVHWPTEEDLLRLASAKGRSRADVLQSLGHPVAVGRPTHGVEVWHYPWQASCSVWFEKGVCVRTFYDAGY